MTPGRQRRLKGFPSLRRQPCPALRHVSDRCAVVQGGGEAGLQLQQWRVRAFCFSGVTHAQLRSDVLEYLTVYGCLSALAAAAVAVTVAVGDTA